MALKRGTAAVKPELGLTYYVIANGKPNFDELKLKNHTSQIVFMWNVEKNDFTWAPYFPFVLTIRDPQHLHGFIKGDIFILVAVDASVLCSKMSKDGWKVTYHPDALYPIQSHHPKSGAKMGLSSRFVGRIGLECMSLDWVAKIQLQMNNEAVEHMNQTYGPFLPTDTDSLKIP